MEQPNNSAWKSLKNWNWNVWKCISAIFNSWKVSVNLWNRSLVLKITNEKFSFHKPFAFSLVLLSQQTPSVVGRIWQQIPFSNIYDNVKRLQRWVNINLSSIQKRPTHTRCFLLSLLVVFSVKLCYYIIMWN